MTPLLEGADEELAERLATFDDHVMAQRQKRTTQQRRLDDSEGQIKAARAEHVALMSQHGELLAQDKVNLSCVLTSLCMLM